jgi:hypothetical protein
MRSLRPNPACAPALAGRGSAPRVFPSTLQFVTGRGIATALLIVTALAARADNWSPNLTTLGAWHNNISNADTSADQIDSLQTAADLVAWQRYAVGRDDSVRVTAHFAGEWWPRYQELMTGAMGGRLGWYHQFGPDPRAAVVSVEGFADGIATNDSNRRGFAVGATVTVRKRFNDLTRGTLSHEVSWMDARQATYDRAASETSFEIDRDLTNVSRLTFTARFRDGDVLSHASGTRPDLEALAPHRLEVTTFGRPMTAYRVDARTWSARVAYLRALDDNSAIVLAYEWRDTQRKPLSFVNNIVSVSFVHQF